MRRAKKNERGFALLLVFLLASAVALMLYRQMPREAFESERDKEQMLIDRGEQYKRAIYLFYVSNNRQWPTKIEDLENTNNHRYLRHRYVDPYTGKDEWRLVHTNGAFLTDSLVTPPPAQATPGSLGSTTATGGLNTPGSTVISSSGGAGNPGTTNPGTTGSSTDPNAPPEVNAQVQRRPSDRTLVQNSNFQNPGGGAPTQGNDSGYQPFNPASLPPISLYPNGYNAPAANIPGVNGTVGQPGLNQNGLNQPGINQAGVNQSGAIQQGLPGFTIPGTNSPVTTPGISPPNFNPTGSTQQGFGQPAQAGNQFGFNQPFASTPQQFQTQPNVPGFNSSGAGTTATPPVPSNQAISLINNLLTTPRQPPTGIGPNQTQTGGGIAGVASTYKGKAIKSYADRSKYQEWEFVFQLNTLTTLQAPQAGPNGQTPNGTPGAPGVPGAPGTAPLTTAPGSTAPGSTGTFGTSGPNSGSTNSGTTNFGVPNGGFGTN